MPRLIEYSEVLQTMQRLGLVSLYYNSGAFGFERDISVEIVGWIGPRDPSIRESMLPLTVSVAPPDARTLAKLVAMAWHALFPGEIWITPKSHWAYELDFGNANWLPGALASIGIDSKILQPQTQAPAIAFARDELNLFQSFTTALLTNLDGSDFQASFPHHQAVATLHHHKQIWWQTPIPILADRLRELARS